MEVTLPVQPVQYDGCGRMMYHPDFHPNQGKPWSKEELAYACKFHEYDGFRCVAMALGRTETTVRTKVYKLQKEGMYDTYRDLWEAFAAATIS
ncbi:DNA-entry nuclease [Ectobacillus ponti]|uniref:DNA-entry nuclease n=1 Tax=Ectobacillus ponti TaxID=2961894 RepID=A0AA42BR37_9BACI|nr:DNA-entry nuclease [Ectobacillus ponti]MCP8970542.1 DNA-entry nuclease [Ectobacillus ponti]